jgi:hypothetical protein
MLSSEMLIAALCSLIDFVYEQNPLPEAAEPAQVHHAAVHSARPEDPRRAERRRRQHSQAEGEMPRREWRHFCLFVCLYFLVGLVVVDH